MEPMCYVLMIRLHNILAIPVGVSKALNDLNQIKSLVKSLVSLSRVSMLLIPIFKTKGLTVLSFCRKEGLPLAFYEA